MYSTLEVTLNIFESMTLNLTRVFFSIKQTTKHKYLKKKFTIFSARAQ